jgi:site-specific recombinase XerD
MRILIRGNTSKRERKVSLSPGLIEKIDNYLNIYQPKNYLFEGHSQTQYSERSIQKVFKKYVLKAGVTGNVSIHSLRHSFAAHLAEEGAEIKDVQKYLGHANIRSTEVYYKLLECDRNNNKSK